MRTLELGFVLSGQRGFKRLFDEHDVKARINRILRGGISLPCLSKSPVKLLLSAMIAIFCMSIWTFAGALEVDTNWLAKGGVAEVKVVFSVPSSACDTLAVLTDYEHMPRFVPGIHSTRLIHEQGNHRLIAIKGAVEFFFIEFPINVVMDVTFLPGDVINLQSLSGNLKVRGVMKVKRSGGQTQVTYVARLEPSFWLPPILGPALIGGQIRKQFAGQIAEIDRRDRVIHVEHQRPTTGLCIRR